MDIGLGAFAASELDKVFSGYLPWWWWPRWTSKRRVYNVHLTRLIAREDFIMRNGCLSARFCRPRDGPIVLSSSSTSKK